MKAEDAGNADKMTKRWVKVFLLLLADAIGVVLLVGRHWVARVVYRGVA